MFWMHKKQTDVTPAKKDPPRRELELVIDGLDVSPDAANALSFESIKALWPDFRVVSDRSEGLECARGEEYSTLFYINKPKGLFEIIINETARTNFLGIKSENPEDLWISHGFKMYENKERSARFSDGRARLLAHYGRRNGGVPGVVELHYCIITPEDAKPVPARRGAWVSLDLRDHARILYFKSMEERDAAFFAIASTVDCLHIEKRDAMDSQVMYPFWLVVSAADDLTVLSRLCGHTWKESQSAEYERVRSHSFAAS